MISTTCVFSWLIFLFVNFPISLLIDAYFIPYLFFVIWLDLVTFLHHTDPTLTYYREGAWNFLKGGLSTMDRSYGFVIDHLHHNIGTHVIHHLFYTRVPHYHLLEATEALKPILGKHYKVDSTPIANAYLKSKNLCKFVDDKGDTVMYQTDEKLE